MSTGQEVLWSRVRLQAGGLARTGNITWSLHRCNYCMPVVNILADWLCWMKSIAYHTSSWHFSANAASVLQNNALPLFSEPSRLMKIWNVEAQRLARLLRCRHVSASNLNRQKFFRGYPQYLRQLLVFDKRSTSFQIRSSNFSMQQPT